MKTVKTFLLVSTLLVVSLLVGNSQVLAGNSDYDGGFAIKSEDSKFTIKVNGFTWARSTYFKPKEGDSQNNFHLGLGRIALSGNAFDPKASYFFQTEVSTFGNNNNISFIDWWHQYTFSPLLSVKMGRFIIPYSRQFYTHPGNLLFPDLSGADLAFNLPRAIGLMASGSKSKISYGAGVVNGIKALDGAPGESNQPGDELSYFGRVEVDILRPFGYLESSAAIAKQPELSIGAALARNQIDYESAGFQKLKVGDLTHNLTIDSGFRYQGLTLQTAYYFRPKDPADDKLEEVNDFGFYAQSGYQIIPGKFEVGARYSMVDFEGVSKTAEYTGGFNYYHSGHNLKFQVDYSLINTKIDGKDASTNDHQVRVQTQILF